MAAPARLRFQLTPREAPGAQILAEKKLTAAAAPGMPSQQHLKVQQQACEASGCLAGCLLRDGACRLAVGVEAAGFG
jgi:hypothetical protein